MDPFCHEVLGPTVSLFDAQMQYLSEHYNVVSLDRVVASLNGEDTLPPNTVAITFDDGYKDTYALAYPILKKHGLPATIFLTTGFVGTNGLLWYDEVSYLINNTQRQTIALNGALYFLGTLQGRKETSKKIISELKKVNEERKRELLEDLRHACGAEVNGKSFNLALSWDEVREMARDGITFGAHTVTHPILTRVPREVAQSEIQDSKSAIEREIQQPVRFFAYPNGALGDFDKEIQGMLEACGFDAACTTIHGRNGFNTDRFALRRLWIGPNDDLPVFKAKLAGIFPIKARLKRAFCFT